MPNTLIRTSSWFSKFFECLYFYIAVVVTFEMILPSFLYTNLGRIDERQYIRLFFYTGGVFALLALTYTIYWHRKQKAENFNSGIRHAWLQGIMRYFIAFEISTYGFAKILKTQFGHIYSRDDVPVGNLTGFDLTWNYFGHSYTFAVILGLMQIVGGILLLFRRTTLLGALLLLPVMINVVFINIFYQIDQGAFINSLVLTAGLSYIILLRWPDFRTLLFQQLSDLPPVKLRLLKPIVKVIAITLAFFSIYRFVAVSKPTAFEGKWNIYELTRNGKPVDTQDWQSNPRAWHTIYMEQYGRVEFSANPYIFEEQRAWAGEYTYNAPKGILNIIFYNGPQSDTIKAKISGYTGKMMQWNMMYNQDTLQMKLIKAGN